MSLDPLLSKIDACRKNIATRSREAAALEQLAEAATDPSMEEQYTRRACAARQVVFDEQRKLSEMEKAMPARDRIGP